MDKNLEYLAAKKQETGVKTLLCCYDVIPTKLPHLLVGKNGADYYAKYFADLARCADAFISISECSKRDLLSLLEALKIPQPPICVVRLGSELPPVAAPLEASEITSIVDRRFIMFVSTIDRRKNHETLYRAYLQLIEQGIGDLPRLVFVGKIGGGVDDLLSALSRDRRTANLIRVLSNVSDAELALLYQECMFTVFPSLYEGWGLAVAESLAMGKFCIASPAASIPEIGGDLVEYVDPLSASLWAERLAFYIQHPEALAAAEARIRDAYKPAKWSDTARSVFERAAALLGPPPAGPPLEYSTRRIAFSPLPMNSHPRDRQAH